LICAGTGGKFFEISSAGAIVWTYINPVAQIGILTQGQTPTNNPVFKIYRYPPSYSAFNGRDLTPQGPIELYPNAVEEKSSSPLQFTLQQNYPNPFNPTTTILFSVGTSHRSGTVSLQILDVLGREVVRLVHENLNAGTYAATLDGRSLSSGVYYYRLNANGQSATKSMMLLK
jgi:hypothetical protein